MLEAFKAAQLIPPPIVGIGRDYIDFTLEDWQASLTSQQDISYNCVHPIYLIQSLRNFPEDEAEEAYTILKKCFDSYTDNKEKLVLLLLLVCNGMNTYYERLVQEIDETIDAQLANLKSVCSLYNAKLTLSLTGNDLIDQAMNLHVESIETKLLSMVNHIYGIFDLGLFGPLLRLSNAVFEIISMIDLKDLQIVYKMHLIDMYMVSLFSQNKIEDCRRLFIELQKQPNLLDQFPNFVVNFYHNMAKTYMFEDFQTCRDSLQQALHIVETKIHYQRQTYKRADILNTLDFTRSLWKIELDIEPYSKAEKAHRHIMLGETKEGLEILEELRMENGQLSSYQVYFEAIAKKDRTKLENARLLFEHGRNRFFAQIIDFHDEHH